MSLSPTSSSTSPFKLPSSWTPELWQQERLKYKATLSQITAHAANCGHRSAQLSNSFLSHSFNDKFTVEMVAEISAFKKEMEISLTEWKSFKEKIFPYYQEKHKDLLSRIDACFNEVWTRSQNFDRLCCAIQHEAV